MRAISTYTEKPKAREIIPIGNGKRSAVFIRDNIKKITVAAEDGEQYDVWTATEYSTTVNTLNFEITDTFAERLRERETAAAAKIVRTARNALLEQTDKEMLTDRADPATEHYQAYAAYRQALRDVPEQTGFPFDVEWPEKPD